MTNYNSLIKDRAKRIKEEALLKIKSKDRSDVNRGRGYYTWEGEETDIEELKKNARAKKGIKEELRRTKMFLYEKRLKDIKRNRRNEEDEQDMEENFIRAPKFFRKKLKELFVRLNYLKNFLEEEAQQADQTTTDSTNLATDQTTQGTPQNQQEQPQTLTPEIINELQNLITIVNNLGSMVGLSQKNDLGADVESQTPASNALAQNNTTISENRKRNILNKINKMQESSITYYDVIDNGMEFLRKIGSTQNFDVDPVTDEESDIEFSKKKIQKSSYQTWEVPELKYASKKENTTSLSPTEKFLNKYLERKKFNFNQLIKEGKLG